MLFIPQIALAIGVLTSNRRGWAPTLAGFTLGAIAGCHCWVPKLGCHCWVTLLGAIAGCGFHCWVPLLGFIAGCHWVPLLGAIGCHFCVPLLDASYQLWWSSRWVPLLGGYCWVPCWGAIAGCHCEEKLTGVLHRSPLHLSL